MLRNQTFFILMILLGHPRLYLHYSKKNCIKIFLEKMDVLN